MTRTVVNDNDYYKVDDNNGADDLNLHQIVKF